MRSSTRTRTSGNSRNRPAAVLLSVWSRTGKGTGRQVHGADITVTGANDRGTGRCCGLRQAPTTARVRAPALGVSGARSGWELLRAFHRLANRPPFPGQPGGSPRHRARPRAGRRPSRRRLWAACEAFDALRRLADALVLGESSSEMQAILAGSTCADGRRLLSPSEDGRPELRFTPRSDRDRAVRGAPAADLHTGMCGGRGAASRYVRHSARNRN